MVAVTEVGSLVLALLIVVPSVVAVPVAVQMVTMATATIFFGSARASKRELERKSGGADAEPRDVLSGNQVYRFPITASLMLTSLFLAFKYLPNHLVSMILTGGSVFLGVVGVANVFAPAVLQIFPEAAWLKKKVGPTTDFSMEALEIITIIAASPIGIWYILTKHTVANNMLASALAYTAVEMLGLEDYKSGAILLCGLFFYDVFWVFYSTKVFGDNVMVTVAKKFEGPIKLLFPRFPGATAADQSMLGLGDIVIPGIFIALLFRVDEHVIPGFDSQVNPLHKPYFTTSMVFYFLGLVTTYIIMAWFNHAQPALLYLVPACLLSSLGVAVVRGEIMTLLKYSESEEIEECAADATMTASEDIKKER